MTNEITLHETQNRMLLFSSYAIRYTRIKSGQEGLKKCQHYDRLTF